MFVYICQFVVKALIVSSMFLTTSELQQKASIAALKPLPNTLNSLTFEYLIAVLNLASRPFAHNNTFNTNVIEQMYRGKMVDGQWKSSDSYPGGLAGAIRRELSKGELVGGVSHLQKGKDRLAQLKDIISKGKIGTSVLDTYDMDIAKALHDDLQAALQTKP